IGGAVGDATGGALPGVTVTLKTDATGVNAVNVTDAEGRYIFDFIEPGAYSVTAELQGFQTSVQKNVRVQQRNNITVDLKMAIASLEESITVTAPPVTVQFKSSSSD